MKKQDIEILLGMDIRTHLLKENSKQNWHEVVTYVGNDKKRFEILIHLFFSSDYRIVQRASQPVGLIAEKNPELIRPYLNQLVDYLQKNPIDAVKRNVMRTFQFIEIPEEIEGELFDVGMEFLKNQDTAIAIKAFSMTVLRRICEKYPELTNELIPQLEILIKAGLSKGIINRGKAELQKLKKIAEKETL